MSATLKPLRIQQLKGEAPGVFAMRAWAMAIPSMSNSEMVAVANWICAYTRAEAKKLEVVK